MAPEQAFDLGRACMDGESPCRASLLLSTDLLCVQLTGNANLVLRHLSSLSSEAAASEATRVDADGRTPLHWAASSCDVEVVRALCDKGAELDKVDGSGLVECIQYSLCAEADSQSLYRWSALHIASSAGRQDNVAELLYRGASPKVVNTKGLTPLHYAASKGHTDVGRRLVEAGADVNARDGAKQCPM